MRDEAVHSSVNTLYLPPVFRDMELDVAPPQTIISEPVHTARWSPRPDGTLAPAPAVSEEEVQESVDGAYRPPVLKAPLLPKPPHTTISEFVHTTV